MHPRVLPPEVWDVVRRLGSEASFEEWTLAGGTGLALQLGHWVSRDLDFFRDDAFEPEALALELSRTAFVEVRDRSADMLHATVGGVLMSFFRLERPLLYPGIPYRQLFLADPRDVAVMKLMAIGGRGSRKDFIDLYMCLKRILDLRELLNLLERRFEGLDWNRYHLLKSLTWFEDAEDEPMPTMLTRVTWDEVRLGIVQAIRDSGLVR